MDQVGEIADYLARVEEVLILSHMIPDGDCLGSALALAIALRAQSKKVTLVNEDQIPEMYRFLPGSNTFLRASNLNEIADTVVIVDSSDLERVGEGTAQLLQKKILINIDHHLSNTRFGHLNYVKTGVSATGELICDLLNRMRIPITPEIATNLYTALVTDSGSFQFESVRPETLEIAARLIRSGANMITIRENLWETRSLINIRMLAKVLPNLGLTPDGKVAWISISKELQEALGAKSEHCEGLINYPRSIARVEIGILFREIDPGVIKVGFRSKSLADVNLLASNFGGGGHARAAGCTIEGKLDEVVKEVVAIASASLE